MFRTRAYDKLRREALAAATCSYMPLLTDLAAYGLTWL
jgi:hypothetical protein